MGMESTMTTLLTVAEFKNRYKISHSAFYREVAANRIPIKKIGRATRIALADAEAWASSLPTQGGEASNG
ncbi:hypothetical protein GCM10023208_00240 [Erythrobacter westpacificensis]|uniref:DNA-binding protein n=2 Tax=Erythrobacter westpacificensis TaxID=1055231 RepID=A0ABP9JY31_9SPHN